MERFKKFVFTFALVVCFSIAFSGSVWAVKDNSKMSAGIFTGYNWSTADEEAVKGYDDTELDSSAILGGSFFYAPQDSKGFGIEAVIETFSMDLNSDSYEIGTLEMVSMMALLKYQGYPSKKIGFAGHADVGIGICFNNFEKGDALNDIEHYTRAHVNVDTDESFIFQLGGGVDYFITPQFSLNLDGKWMYNNVPIKVSAAGYRIDEFDEIDASNLQLLAGVKYWIK